MSERSYNIIIIILIAFACVIVGALLYLIYDATVAPPAVVPTTPIPSPTNTPAPSTEVTWDRINASGKMIAGTSADYPPFAFRTGDFALDGLDIAIINEIASRMGFQVEMNDMAFEGISGALALGQVDVAIAALSITPERQASIDFSDVYFVSEDAALARIDSNISNVNSIEELAGYRIGVQRATVFSNWVYETLVDPGLMPASQVNDYERVEDAVGDLRRGIVDIVILDLPPAEVAVAQGGLTIIGQGLNTQYFAIGIPKGEETLRREINNALSSMYSDGTLGTLVQNYMGITPQPLPTAVPTPGPGVPTPTPAPPDACVDGMEFIEDINLDDNGMTTPPVMPPGQPFRKGWRIRNSGTCTWDSGYRLTYDGGNSPAATMSGQPTPIYGTVAPGQEYDMYVDLVAPLAPGVYQGFWVMVNKQNEKFGNRIWVGIQVPRPPTPTPPPTQTPVPGIDYKVDRNRIFAGECVTFVWNVTGAQAVYFYEQGQPWQQNQVPPASTATECPPVTTTYELRVVKPDGTVEVLQITVFVDPVPGAPIIERFTVAPPYQITLGQCVDITWLVTGGVTEVKLFRDQTVLSQNAPVSGTLQDCPPQGGQIAYIIEARGPGGTSRLQRPITVIIPEQTSTPTPPPTVTTVPVTPTPIPPIIYAFTVNPLEVQTGECVSIGWQVGGDVSQIQLKRDGVVILDNAPYNGTEQDCLDSGGSVIYQLLVIGESAVVIQEEETVTVTDAPTNLPLVGTMWQLEAYYDGFGALISILPNTTITAGFDGLGQLVGNAGCNTYSSTYSTSENTLNIGPPTSTQQLCTEPAGIMEQEEAYLAILPTAVTYETTTNSLSVYDGANNVILRYNAVP